MDTLALFDIPAPAVGAVTEFPGQLDLLDEIAAAVPPLMDEQPVMPGPVGVLWDVPELRGQAVLA